MVSACLGVPEKMRKDIREVSKVYTKPGFRGMRMASHLLQKVCEEADAKKMILLLIIEPYGDDPGQTKDQLHEWYSTTFDFHPIQQAPLILARQFNPFPKSGLTEKIGQIITEGI